MQLFALVAAASSARMTTHVSVRVAWHGSGWNSRIRRDPKSNTYCVGEHFSYHAGKAYQVSDESR
jgi:hypothetical protein